MPLPAYEKLGSFYLGREIDPATNADKADLLLYDSRDLTTHAVCVGMTGSGKTGLCLSLLEEAAIDGIPAIAIDPKGDIGNLLLSFPELQASDFAPWVDAGEAARKGLTVEAFAEATAQTWRKGLADWDQDGERIRRLHEAADFAIYTPGSTSGRPLSVLRSFAAPAPELRADGAILRERIAATVAGLLSLVGIDADPIKSREHILLSTLFEQAWSQGRDLDLKALIQSIQKPGVEHIGVLDLETFYPAKERLALAMSLNNLVAAPGFAAWMQGEPLDIQRLLFTDSGKPRIAIISIAHLSDAERMFVVTLILGEIVAWMRRQSGTSSLRALFYMDEIFGYFPPTAMPPSKQPLLTLMKQARAFGIGVVLATQNPVDLDYKGLSNAGTWFIGRLQTERDKARVIEGLLAAGSGIDKAQFDTLLANLQPRSFLMRNAHEDAPVLFRTRWAMSYLRGPLTLPEIARLTSNAPTAMTLAEPASAPREPSVPQVQTQSKPVVAANIPEFFLTQGDSDRLAPFAMGTVRMHFVNSAAGVEVWETRTYLAPLTDGDPNWAEAEVLSDVKSQLSNSPPANASFAALPASASRAESYKSWSKQLESHVYSAAGLDLLRAPAVNATSVPGGTEAEFRARLALAVREKRDAAGEALRRKYGPKLASLQDQVRRAEDRVAREQAQLSQRKMDTAISIGTSILGAFLGRKAMSATNAGRLGSAARGAGRIGRESEDVTRANESLEVIKQRHADLEREFNDESAELQRLYDPGTVAVERVTIKPRKSDIDVTLMGLLWK